MLQLFCKVRHYFLIKQAIFKKILKINIYRLLIKFRIFAELITILE